MTARQTLAFAVRVPSIRRALSGLVGCPQGGWGETVQAIDRIEAAIPLRENRDYTLTQLISHALTIDSAERYQWRRTEGQ